MPLSEENEGIACHLQYAINNFDQENGVTLKNVEFTEPHSHIFHGYTDHENDLHQVTKQFQNPGKVDVELEPHRYLEYASKIPQRPLSEENGKGGKHFYAGAIAGAVASTILCPLEVIKTRQQASGHSQGFVASPKTSFPKLGSSSRTLVRFIFQEGKLFDKTRTMQTTSFHTPYFNDIVSKHGPKIQANSSFLQHYRNIIQVEGPRSLYKGLGPTLVGVVPSRAIYFYAYSRAKKFCVDNLGLTKDSSKLHLVSAGLAGLCSTTATSPLWVIKTKLQLHHRNLHSPMNVRQCMAKIWNAQGIKGFYRGLTASYAGIIETMIYFMIYEKFKLMHQQSQHLDFSRDSKSWSDYIVLMAIAAMSKSTATCIAYPHEVVRTRLREETKQNKYRGFFQTLSAVAKTEGAKALYRGLGTQIVRQVPNMAIIMGTYEFIINPKTLA